jgi:hypothetical protein
MIISLGKTGIASIPREIQFVRSPIERQCRTSGRAVTGLFHEQGILFARDEKFAERKGMADPYKVKRRLFRVSIPYRSTSLCGTPIVKLPGGITIISGHPMQSRNLVTVG